MKKFVPIVPVIVAAISVANPVFADSPNANQAQAIPSETTSGANNHMMTADELKQQGKQLRAEVEGIYKKLLEEKKLGGDPRIDVSPTVVKYITIGTSFKDAEVILKAAGFDLAPSPPRPARSDNPYYDRYSIMGGTDLQNWGIGVAGFAADLTPDNPGAADAKVKEAHGIIYINTL